MKRINNKTAFMTGASSGIGEAIAKQLANEGYVVILTARRTSYLKRLQKQILIAGGKALAIQADLSSVHGIDKLVSQVKLKVNRIDVLVNCAAVWHGRDQAYCDIPYTEYKQKTILDTLNVGLVAPMLLTRRLVNLIPKGGSIINITGTFENGGKGWLPYFTAKRGLEDFSLGLAQELKSKCVKVCCISPSDTATEAYKKFFPEYIEESVKPDVIASWVNKIINDKDIKTGDCWAIRKDQKPYLAFHA